MPLEKELIDVNKLLYEILEEAKLVAGTHTVVPNIEDGGNVYADREKISSVIWNLVNNAVKYSPGEQPSGWAVTRRRISDHQRQR